jgi:hypothetical protein
MDSLLPLKNSLDELKTRIKDTKRAIDDILGDDDHMMKMNSLKKYDDESATNHLGIRKLKRIYKVNKQNRKKSY